MRITPTCRIRPGGAPEPFPAAPSPVMVPRVAAPAKADAPYARARGDSADVDVATVEALVSERSRARIAGEYDTADAIRDRLRNEFGVSVDDRVKEWVVDGRPASSTRVTATALAATELRRQDVTHSKLRGLKVALRRTGATIDGDALQKALATQNLELRDANVSALIREAAWRAANNEEGAPTKAPLINVLTMLADLLAPESKAPAPIPAAAPAPAAAPVATGALDLGPFETVAALEALGLDRLKSALMAAGLKCGGTLRARAERLLSTRGKDWAYWDPNILAKQDVRAKIERYVKSLQSIDAAGESAIEPLRALAGIAGGTAATAADRASIIDAGGIAVLVSLATYAPGLLSRGDISVKMQAMRLLKLLADDDEPNRDAIKKAGAIPPLLELVRTAGTLLVGTKSQGTKGTLALMAVKALTAIAGDDDAYRTTISEALVVLSSTSSTRYQGAAARAVEEFARNAANCDAIVDAGGLPPLLKMVNNGTCIEGVHVGRYAARALAALAYDAAKGAAIIAAGAIPPLVAMVEKGPHFGGQEEAARALGFLARDDESKGAIIRAGAIEPLNMLLNNGTPSARERAAETLRKLGAPCVSRLESEKAALADQLKEETERADDQGTNAMYLHTQKSELQRLVSDAANALLDSDADVPTKEVDDDATPFYYMLESHRDDGKQTVPWNVEAGRPMTLAGGIAWIQNNRPSKKRRTRRPESDRLTDSLSSSNVPRRAAAAGRSARGSDRRGRPKFAEGDLVVVWWEADATYYAGNVVGVTGSTYSIACPRPASFASTRVAATAWRAV